MVKVLCATFVFVYRRAIALECCVVRQPGNRPGERAGERGGGEGVGITGKRNKLQVSRGKNLPTRCFAGCGYSMYLRRRRSCYMPRTNRKQDACTVLYIAQVVDTGGMQLKVSNKMEMALALDSRERR